MKERRFRRMWIILAVGLIAVMVFMLRFGLWVHYWQSVNNAYHLPESHVKITGTLVDNHYNNYISAFDPGFNTGEFVRVGNKLYFNYRGSYKNYGLYEISDCGAQRVFWEGYGPWAFLTGHEYILYPIREYDGNLVINTIVDGNYYVYNWESREWELTKGGIQTYCEETQTFVETKLYGGVSDIYALNYQKTSFGFVYESSEKYDLWVYTEAGGLEQLVPEDVVAFYSVEEQIYYLSCADGNDQYILRMFDWNGKTDTTIREWTDYSSMSNIIIEDNWLVFGANHAVQNTWSLYKLDLRNPGQKEDILFTIDRNDPDAVQMYSWNVWNETAYLCTNQGLIACDLNIGEQRMLCEGDILECDIVDDTWVYFLADDSMTLWRVPQHGGAAELVLG